MLTRRYRISFILVMAFIILITFNLGSAQADEISIQDGVLVINAYTNHFASIVRYSRLEGGDYGKASFELKMRGGDGTTWAPGMYLYWSHLNWVGLRLVGSNYCMEGTFNGSWRRSMDWPIPNKNQWNRLKLVLTPDEVQLYAAYLDEDWMHLCDVPRPVTNEEPYLIIGKGFSSSKYTTPYMANSYIGGAGSLVKTFVDDVMIQMDDKIIFRDNFTKGIEENWIALIDGDPALSEKIELIDAMKHQKGPNPFKEAFIYPNPSREDNEVRIAYYSSNLALIKLSIYDEEGRLIWQAEEEPLELGYNEVIWEGHDMGGIKVSTGLYTCVISQANKNGMADISSGRILRVP